MLRTNGTLPYHCYRTTNATDAHISCVPTLPTPPYRCVSQFANTGCLPDLLLDYYRYSHVSRQLQAVDCDVDGGIVMKEIAVSLCVARGLLSSLSRNSHIEVDNQPIIHSSFWQLWARESSTAYSIPSTALNSLNWARCCPVSCWF
jgi:hypothetical protein